MHRFFVIDDNGIIRLRDDDVRHAQRVLRLGPGDEIEAVFEAQRWEAAILTSGETVQIELKEKLEDTEPGSDITLFQGLPKAEKMEWIIQKGTELGINRFCPVMMERSVPMPDRKNAARKQERWRTIATEAVKQCGRSRIPAVDEPVGLKAALQALRNTDVLLVPWEGSIAGQSPAIHDVLKPLKEQSRLSVGILIGPEGGISETEMQWLQSNVKATAVTLGPRILRTETAAIAATVLVLEALGEME